MAIGDVKAGSDISLEFSIGIISRSADVPDATIFAVMTPQAIVHFKRLAIIESFVVGLETLGHVRRMNTFGPSIAEFLLKGTSREIEPAPVEVITFFIHGWLMSARQARLDKKLEELKANLKERP